MIEIGQFPDLSSGHELDGEVVEGFRRDIGRWMPGLRPGDPVAGELNPLSYSRRAG